MMRMVMMMMMMMMMIKMACNSNVFIYFSYSPVGSQRRCRPFFGGMCDFPVDPLESSGWLVVGDQATSGNERVTVTEPHRTFRRFLFWHLVSIYANKNYPLDPIHNPKMEPSTGRK